MKTQKTFKTDGYDLGFEPTVGEEVVLVSHLYYMRVLVSHLYYMRSENSETYTIRRAPDGIPGNSDHTIKRFHGWRGTYNYVATYAHGLRKILKVTPVDLGADYGYKITVGPDLHPDWD